MNPPSKENKIDNAQTFTTLKEDFRPNTADDLKINPRFKFEKKCFTLQKEENNKKGEIKNEILKKLDGRRAGTSNLTFRRNKIKPKTDEPAYGVKTKTYNTNLFDKYQKFLVR